MPAIPSRMIPTVLPLNGAGLTGTLFRPYVPDHPEKPLSKSPLTIRFPGGGNCARLLLAQTSPSNSARKYRMRFDVLLFIRIQVNNIDPQQSNLKSPAK